MLRLLHYYVLCVLALNAQEPSSFGGLRFRELPKPVRCPEGINDLGEMVRGCSFETDAYFVAADGTETLLPVPGHPSGINNLGQIVLNHNGRITLLHRDGRTESRTVEGARSAIAHGINNKGEIAGEADGKPVVWKADGAWRTFHIPQLSWSSQQGHILDINDSGAMIGANSYLGYWLFRWTHDGFFRLNGETPTGWRGDVASDGVILASYIRGRTLVSYAADQDLRGLFNFRPRRFAYSMSPNGQLFLGEDFVAERCATEVTPLRAEVPLTGGALRVRVAAEPGCEWSYSTSNGDGSAEVELTVDASQEPRVIQRIVAGKEISIHQGPGACGFKVPGFFTAPSSGGTFRIPVTVTEGCSWSAHSDSTWVVVDSALIRTGSATVSIRVEPNPGAGDRDATLTLSSLRMLVKQGPFFCTYRLRLVELLPPGAGAWMPPVETQPGCTWSLSSSAPWLLELSAQEQLNFAPNPTNAARSAPLAIAGQRYTITQQPARPGEPYSVEPFDGSGPRQTFRFKFPEPLTHTRLSIGKECTIEYSIGFRPFAVTGTCSLEDASSVVADGFRVLTVSVALRERGLLIVAAGGRQLGVFRSTDAPSTPLLVTRPTEVPANPPQGSSLWIDSRRGVGGIFRVRVDPSLGTPHSISFGFGKCVVTIQPAARTMRLENFIEADGPPKPTAEAHFGSSGKLQTPYCMADPERSRLALPVVDLAVFFPFHNAPSGTMRLSIVTTEGLPPVVTDLGSYVVTTTATAPVLTFPDGRMKVVFRSNVPIEQAQVEIGGCLVTYNRRGGSETNRFCSGSIETSIIGNDVVMRMNLSFLPNTQFAYVNIRTNFTPEGLSATGWFINYVNYLIGFNGAGP